MQTGGSLKFYGSVYTGISERTGTFATPFSLPLKNDINFRTVEKNQTIQNLNTAVKVVFDCHKTVYILI